MRIISTFPTFVLAISIGLSMNFTIQRHNNKVVGSKFPIIESKSLSGNTVKLPDCVKGKITLVTVAFLESGQPYVDSWAEPYLSEYFQKEGFEYYEIPMLNNLPEATRNYIDSGMRAGIDKKMHPNVVTFYGDYSPFLKTLEINNLGKGYAFLLNRDGIIIYKGYGMMTENNWEEIERIIANQ